MLRGVASDVLWEDMFVTPALDVLKRQGISGAPPPNSVFVADPTRATVTSMVSVWQRWHGVQTSNTSGTVHGTNIEYVKVMPASETLTQGSIKTIKIRKDLAFVVGVKNGGDFLESDIKVTLQINQKTQPIKKVFTIGSIYSGATTDVIFKNFAITDPINILPVKVDVAPVPSETNKANNQATYEVRFSF